MPMGDLVAEFSGGSVREGSGGGDGAESGEGAGQDVR
jgi:hypothetical protein